MKAKLALVLLGLCLIVRSAAATEQTLYPVQGPLVAQAPPPVMKASFHGAYSGSFSLVQAPGESFQGKWTDVIPSFVNTKTPETPASYLPQPNLAFAWDAVYGPGYFVAQILGAGIRQAVATGNQGTVIQVECRYSPVTGGCTGVAVDSKGNIYKVVWP
jgi:hypothetical protein